MSQLSSCCFPKFGSAFHGPKRPVAIRTKAIPDQNPQLLSAWHQGRLGFLLQATWALVLRCYTSSEDVCFGFQLVEAGGSTQSTDLSTIRFLIDESDTLKGVIGKAMDNNLSNTHRDLNSNNDDYTLFNTILMLRSYCHSKTGHLTHSQPTAANPLPDKASFDVYTSSPTI